MQAELTPQSQQEQRNQTNAGEGLDGGDETEQQGKPSDEDRWFGLRQSIGRPDKKGADDLFHGETERTAEVTRIAQPHLP